MEHQIDGLLRHALYCFVWVDLFESWKGGFEFGNLSDSRPVLLRGSAPKLEDLENLIYFGVSYKEGSLFVQLIKNAADCPGVNSKGVLSLSQ